MHTEDIDNSSIDSSEIEDFLQEARSEACLDSDIEVDKHTAKNTQSSKSLYFGFQ